MTEFHETFFYRRHVAEYHLPKRFTFLLSTVSNTNMATMRTEMATALASHTVGSKNIRQVNFEMQYNMATMLSNWLSV
jgi:hypothetical protein